MEYATKTQHYLKVKKPLLERQRRARINKCLGSMKNIIAELQNDDAILRMDKAEMLETAIAYLRQTKSKNNKTEQMDSYRNGYINAANEVSRVLASTRGISADMGKTVMTHLGYQFNKFQESNQATTKAATLYMHPLTINVTNAPTSPASSGYHSDMESPASSPTLFEKVWRPW